MLKSKGVELDALKSRTLVMTCVKYTIREETKTKRENWLNQDEEKVTLEENTFVEKVTAAEKSTGEECPYYIMVHGGRTTEVFLSLMKTFEEKTPGFIAQLMKIPMALNVPEPGPFDKENIDAFNEAGLFNVIVCYGKIHSSTLEHCMKTDFMQDPTEAIRKYARRRKAVQEEPRRHI